MTQSNSFVADLMTALKREWWIVALAVVVALGVGFFMASSGDTTSFQGMGTIQLDSVTLAKSAPLMTADRLIEALKSPEFYQYAADKTGLSVSEVKKVATVTAANKARDRLTVRVTGANKDQTQTTADAFANAVVSYASEKGTTGEVGRLKQVIKLNENSLAIGLEQKKRELAGGKSPLALVQIEGQINNYRQNIVNAQAALDPLLVAYKVAGPVKVTEQSSGSKLQRTLIGAGILGLFLGLAIAALREYVLRGKQRSA